MTTENRNAQTAAAPSNPRLRAVVLALGEVGLSAWWKPNS